MVCVMCSLVFLFCACCVYGMCVCYVCGTCVACGVCLRGIGALGVALTDRFESLSVVLLLRLVCKRVV